MVLTYKSFRNRTCVDKGEGELLKVPERREAGGEPEGRFHGIK